MQRSLALTWTSKKVISNWISHSRPWTWRSFSLIGAAGLCLYSSFAHNSEDARDLLKYRDSHVTVYQHSWSADCWTVRSMLDMCHIPYIIVNAHPLLRSSDLRVAGGAPKQKLPSLLLNGDIPIVLNGKVDIFRSFRSSTFPLPFSFSSDSKHEQRIGDITDLAVINSYDNPRRCFSAVSRSIGKSHFNFLSRGLAIYGYGLVLYMNAIRTRRSYSGRRGMERSKLYDAMRWWTMNALKDNQHKFCGGDTPSLADITVFGVLRSMEFVNEDVFTDVLSNTGVGPWYERMSSFCGEGADMLDVMKPLK